MKISVSVSKLSPKNLVKNINFKSFFDFNKKNVYAILIKDLKQNFFSNIGYGIIVLFIVIFSFLFFGLFGYLRIPVANIGILFTSIGYAFVVVLSATSMGSISREKFAGTLESILAKPVKVKELILAKFFSQLVFVFIILLFTIPILLVTLVFTQFQIDLGAVFSQYFGAFLLGSSFVSVGIAFSSIFKNEITALLSSVLLLVILIVAGSGLVTFLPRGFEGILSQISLLTRYEAITRGVIDSKDVIYFILFDLFFLTLAYYFVLRDRFPAKSFLLRRVKLSIFLIVFIFVFINLISYNLNIRIDLTRDKIFTISSETKQVLEKINDILNIKLFASNNIPQQLQTQLATIEGWLIDYKNQNQFINLEILKRDMTREFVDLASKEGISPTGISVTEDNATRLSAGIVFGVSLKYKDRTKSINLLENDQNFSDFEYILTSTIYSMVNENKKIVGIATNGSYLNPDSGLSILNKEIKDLFDVRYIDLLKDNIDLPSNLNLLIVFASESDIPESNLQKVKDYFDQGGNMMFFAQGHTILNNSSSPSLPSVNNSNLLKIFEDYGINIAKNVIYDKQNFLKYPQRVGLFDFELVNFYFGPEFLVIDSNNSITRNINRIYAVWSSYLSIDENKIKDTESKLIKLLTTSNSANSLTVEDYIKFSGGQDQNLPDAKQNLDIAILLSNKNKGNAIIMADSDFVENQNLQLFINLDQFEQRSTVESSRIASNIGFFFNGITYLVEDIDLGAIKSKNRNYPIILDNQSYSIYLPLFGIGLPLGVLIFIWFRVYRYKKTLQAKKYNF